MPKPEKTVETEVEFVTEDGVRKKKTTVTTTIVTETPGGGTKTSTSKSIKTEQVPAGYKETEEVTRKVEKLTVEDEPERKHDKRNDMSSKDADKFRKECIEAINDFRKKHGASKLKESRDLEKKAQEHAVEMLANDSLSLIQGVRLGQSLAMKMPRPSGKDVAKYWYEEKCNYDYKKAEFVRGAGNFTQIVWKDSKDIGIGVASNEAGETFIIALFDPPGNVKGQFVDNVKRD